VTSDVILTNGSRTAAEAGHGLLRIDLGALQRNWSRLAREAAPAECGATVKANAYGLGLVPCAKALREAGCDTFFVALPEEGACLRQALPEATIYVLSGLTPGSGPLCLAQRLVPALGSLEEVEEWAALTRDRAERPKAALHIDTGMNRLGLSLHQARALAKGPLLSEIDVDLVVSHLACADDAASPINRRQLEAFAEARRLLPHGRASLSNSPGLFLGREYHHDLVRPGIALYGGNPFIDRPNPMLPVIELTSTLLQVREVAPGETVGYGASWTARRPSRIGVVASGYGDGLRRSLAAGDAAVSIANRRAPVVGRVSMDLLTVDLTDIPPGAARRGARVELVGPHIPVDDVARWAGTIPYEILTGLGSRYARLYSPAESTAA